MWTRAHVGTLGNEMADDLAKRGSSSESLVLTTMPASHKKAMIMDQVLLVWKNQWIAYPHARQTKQFFPQVRESVTKELFGLLRQDIGRFVRLCTGHNNLNYHASLRDAGISAMCRLCENERETFHHFLTECPRLLSDRAEIFKDYSGPDLNGSTWSVNDICLLYTSPSPRD